MYLRPTASCARPPARRTCIINHFEAASLRPRPHWFFIGGHGDLAMEPREIFRLRAWARCADSPGRTDGALLSLSAPLARSLALWPVWASIGQCIILPSPQPPQRELRATLENMGCSLLPPSLAPRRARPPGQFRSPTNERTRTADRADCPFVSIARTEISTDRPTTNAAAAYSSLPRSLKSPHNAAAPTERRDKGAVNTFFLSSP